MEDHVNDASYMVERATSINEDGDMLNAKIINMYPGSHKLTLKRSAPIVLLRNIDPKIEIV